MGGPLFPKGKRDQVGIVLRLHQHSKQSVGTAFSSYVRASSPVTQRTPLPWEVHPIWPILSGFCVFLPPSFFAKTPLSAASPFVPFPCLPSSCFLTPGIRCCRNPLSPPGFRVCTLRVPHPLPSIFSQFQLPHFGFSSPDVLL